MLSDLNYILLSKIPISICSALLPSISNDRLLNNIIKTKIPPLWPVGVFFNLWHKQFNHFKGNITIVLMHDGIVNGYQLMCAAHTVLEPHRGTSFFLFYSLSSFSTFSFYVFVILTVLFLWFVLII